MKNTAHQHRPAKNSCGFTLIELLVVMFVLGILVALIVGVGGWIRQSGKEKQTINHQKIVMAAIQAFYDVTGEYPPDREDPNDADWKPAKSGEALLSYLRSEQDDPTDPPDLQRERARIRARTTKILSGLPQGALSTDGEILDGFGKAMAYDADGGLGGFPVLISGGPDKDFGDDDPEKRTDNIRSDKQ